jgi:hypothetical protein
MRAFIFFLTAYFPVIKYDKEQFDRSERVKFMLAPGEGDHFFIGTDQVKRRVVVHIAASPTRTKFLKRWILVMTEVARLDIEKDAPIDVVCDYSEAKPVQPNLKVIMFTKALGAGMLLPNVQTWRVVPGDPGANDFLQRFSREMSSSWLPLRKNEKVFWSVKEAEGYLDEIRAQEQKN